MSQSLGRLTIEGFAGIDDLDMDVRPITVLIGPQSVGKSLVAKLLFFFRSAPRHLFRQALKDTKLNAASALLERFTEIFPAPTHSKGTARITYAAASSKFILEHEGDSTSSWKIQTPVALRQAFRTLVNDLTKDAGDEELIEENDIVMQAYLDRIDQFWQGAAINPRFVPAGRAFFSQIEHDIASYLESASLDPFVAEFGKFLALLKARRRLREYLPAAEPAKVIADQLLSGRYEREGNQQFIYSVDGRKLPPRLWSSGQQEVQPLTLMLQRYCEGFFDPTSLFIEEPEAHLFPSSQRLVTELIALAYNARQPGMQIFLTTHSPYILTTINNLLLAGQLYQGKLAPKKKSELAQVVAMDRALLAGTVGAFYMDRTECRSIIDPETDLIGSSAIDEVSSGLNEQFDELLEIERS